LPDRVIRVVVRHLSLTICFAVAVLIAAGALAPGHAGAQERPFEPTFEVASALKSAGEPTQVQIYFSLEEGHAFPKRAVLEIPAAYQIPPGSDVPNNDIVGEGQITIKAGALGIQTVALCLSNKNPPSPGDYATINVAVMIGSSDPGSCQGLLNLTFGVIKRSESEPYLIEIRVPDAAQQFGLDTPLKLTVNLRGTTRANEKAIPPTSGGVDVFKNPSTPGIYTWKLTVSDAAGRTKELEQPQRIDAPPPKPSETGKKLARAGAIAAVVAGSIVLILVIVWLARRKARRIYEEVALEQPALEDYYYDYYDYGPSDHEAGPDVLRGEDKSDTWVRN
jgi:hypothetical protein